MTISKRRRVPGNRDVHVLSGKRGWMFAGLLGLTANCGATDLIGKITHEEILQRITRQSNIVFVDAREPDEFAEERLPGAVNMPLRTAATKPNALLPPDALVIPYCIKDFRGFEVARALRRAGYQVRVMEDPGLKGWKKAKLPTAGEIPNATDEKALAELRVRASR